MHGNAARHLCQRRIADEARLRHNDFITRLDERTKRKINRLASAYGDNDLVRRIVGKSEPALLILRNLLAQLHQTVIGGIIGAPFLQRAYARFTDVPRRYEIGLPHRERNNVLLVTEDIEEFTDPGRLEADGTAGKHFRVINHYQSFPLLSVSSLSNTISLSL